MEPYVSLGPTPSDEPCAQIGEDDYVDRARAECQRFITLLRRTFGPEPEGAKLRVKWFPHDFGEYAEVVCFYDPDIPESVKYAFRCDAEAPTTWAENENAGEQPVTENVQQCPECEGALEPGYAFSINAGMGRDGYLCRLCKIIFTHDLQVLVRMI